MLFFRHHFRVGVRPRRSAGFRLLVLDEAIQSPTTA